MLNRHYPNPIQIKTFNTTQFMCVEKCAAAGVNAMKIAIVNGVSVQKSETEQAERVRLCLLVEHSH